MALLEDILLRFRRVWAPAGAVAGQASVPADLEARVDDELRELTAALNAIAEEGHALIRAAEAESANSVTAAKLEAERILETARSRIPEARAKRAAACIRDRRSESDDLIAGAEKQARELRDRARSRMPAIVDRAVNAVFAQAPGSGQEEHARVVGGG